MSVIPISSALVSNNATSRMIGHSNQQSQARVIPQVSFSGAEVIPQTSFMKKAFAWTFGALGLVGCTAINPPEPSPIKKDTIVVVIPPKDSVVIAGPASDTKLNEAAKVVKTFWAKLGGLDSTKVAGAVKQVDTDNGVDALAHSYKYVYSKDDPKMVTIYDYAIDKTIQNKPDTLNQTREECIASSNLLAVKNHAELRHSGWYSGYDTFAHKLEGNTQTDFMDNKPTITLTASAPKQLDGLQVGTTYKYKVNVLNVVTKDTVMTAPAVTTGLTNVYGVKAMSNKTNTAIKAVEKKMVNVARRVR